MELSQRINLLSPSNSTGGGVSYDQSIYDRLDGLEQGQLGLVDSVDILNGRITSTETRLSTAVSEIEKKGDLVTITAQLKTKANQSDLTALNAGLGNISAVLTTKANQSSITSLSNQISNISSALNKTSSLSGFATKIAVDVNTTCDSKFVGGIR